MRAIKSFFTISTVCLIAIICFRGKAMAFYSRCEKDPKACEEGGESKAKRKDFSKTEWVNWVKPERSETVLKAWSVFKEKHPEATITWDENTGFPSMISNFETEPYGGSSKQVVESFIEEYQDLLGISFSNLGIPKVEGRNIRMANGITYPQIYKGIPIEGAKVFVSVKQGGVVASIGMNYYHDIRIKDVTPILTSDDAIRTIKEDLGVLEGPVKEPNVSLVLYRPWETPPALFLAWKIEIEFPEEIKQSGMLSKTWLYYIDAHTGEVLHVWDYKIY